MTEPLYQFYDKDSDTLLYSKGSSEASNSSDQMDEEDDNSREDDEDDDEEEEKSGEENMYESVENLLSLPSIRASLRKTRASRFAISLGVQIVNLYQSSCSSAFFLSFHNFS